MTKPIIDPSKVRWRFFSLDSEGNVVVTDDIPDDKRPVALINSSTFPLNKIAGTEWLNKSETPKLLKQKISAALRHDGAEGICFALPCEDIATMREYYGAENLADAEDNYVMIRMHDDLRKGNKGIIPHEARFEGTMPAKEGAEQIASAIEHGFDIWSYNSGGNSIEPKLELCEEYFAAKFSDPDSVKLPAQKVKFVGFSNGTSMAFHLRGLVDYALGYGMSYSLYRESYEGKDEGSLYDQTTRLLRSFSGEKVQVKREFKKAEVDASYEENFRNAKARYEAARATGAPISNVAFWLGQAVPVTMGKLPKFNPDEKIILELEHSMQHGPQGYEVGKTLERFVESGAIDPANIICITLGEFIDHTEEEIKRVHGVIPEYESLSESEQKKIYELAEKKSITPKQYIDQSNARSQELMGDIRLVAAEKGIPVIEGGARRVSHGKFSQLATSFVENLEFDESDFSIRQTCALRCGVPVDAPLVAMARRSAKHKLKDQEAVVISTDAIDAAKITPLRQSDAAFISGGEKDVIVGLPVDLATLPSSEFAGKGAVVYLPMVPRSISSSEQFNAFQLSQNYQDAEFIVLLTPLSNKYASYCAATGLGMEDVIRDRDANYRKLVEDLGGSKPVFISTTSVDLENFTPFSHRIDLAKMTSPSVEPQVESGVGFGAARDGGRG